MFSEHRLAAHATFRIELINSIASTGNTEPLKAGVYLRR